MLPATEASSGAEHLNAFLTSPLVTHCLLCTCQRTTSLHQSCCYLFICLRFFFSLITLLVLQHFLGTHSVADRTQQLLYLSGSLTFGETLVICQVPRPLQSVGPISAKTVHYGCLWNAFFFFLPLTLLHFIVVQLHLEFLFFFVSVGQFRLVSATQAAIAEKADGSMLSESFSNLPSAGHRNGVVKPVIEFQLRLSGLLSRQSLLWLHHRQRAISPGEMQPTTL